MKDIVPIKLSENKPMGIMRDEIYPKLYIDVGQFPPAKNWKVGKEYQVTFKVRMTGYSENESFGSKGNATFELRGYDIDKEDEGYNKKSNG